MANTLGHAASELNAVALALPGQPTDKRVYLACKRVFDVAVAASLLLVLMPLLLIIALLVWVDSPGPILFKQQRVGRDGQLFVMWKFRTMIPDRRKRSGTPPDGIPERRRRHKTRHDPRITRVGRVLRRTCADELPQLWHVVTGEMSIVGPRPELPAIVAAYEPWQHARHAMRPGVTGWWQVTREDLGDKLMHEATELDLYYVTHASFRLDALILWRTLGIVTRGVGAF